jgi:predicted NAD/FAD-binding protein
VLFEQSDRLGGHVHTIDVGAQSGVAIPVEVGMRFCSHAGWPLLVRLLEHLGIELEEYDQALTFHDRADGWTLPLPPTGSMRRWSSLAQSRARNTMIEFKRLLDLAAPHVASGGWELNVGDALEQWRIDERVRNDFVLPYVASNWGLPIDAAATLSARNAFAYTCKNRPTGLGSSKWLNVRGGLNGYVDALVASLTGTRIVSGEPWAVRGVGRDKDGKLAVGTEAGNVGAFDHVVLACSAEDASGLLAAMPETEAVREVLDRFEYFDTRVAVHRDASLLPPERADWSNVQLVRDGNECAIHEWNGHGRDVDVFRSWITHAARLPAADKVVLSMDYRHGKPTPEYFVSQSALVEFQGRAGLWFAGLWTRGLDNHESALASAIRIAEELAPQSKRLTVFRDGAPQKNSAG